MGHWSALGEVFGVRALEWDIEDMYWDGTLGCIGMGLWGALGWDFGVHWDGTLGCIGMGLWGALGWDFGVHWDGTLGCIGMGLWGALGWDFGVHWDGTLGCIGMRLQDVCIMGATFHSILH